MVKIKFTKDFNHIKTGVVREFSRDIANIFIKELKVAKIFEEKKTTTAKPKK